jgi:hypothetical protein
VVSQRTEREALMTSEWERPVEPEDERPVVDEPDEDAPAAPPTLDAGIEEPEADVLEQALEVPLDDDDYEA